jgi:hypothetical protein
MSVTVALQTAFRIHYSYVAMIMVDLSTTVYAVCELLSVHTQLQNISQSNHSVHTTCSYDYGVSQYHSLCGLSVTVSTHTATQHLAVQPSCYFTFYINITITKAHALSLCAAVQQVF